MKAFFEAERPHDGWSYADYLDHWEQEKDTPLTAEMDAKERKMIHYKKYNYDRSQDVHAAYEPSGELRAALNAIDEPQLWMVLTETWCGDSAYNLPVIAEAAASSDRVTLRILPRDENLDIMDQYLTGGSRSIPKLVAFDEKGRELFTWGPRPEDVRALREELLEEGLDGMALIQKLLDRYEDGAWQAVDAELATAIRSAELVSV